MRKAILPIYQLQNKIKMTQEVFQEMAVFQKAVAELKAKAPIYPKILIEERQEFEWEKWRTNYYATTMVEFVYNGIQFKRHHVEKITETENIGKQDALDRINHRAEECLKYAIPSPYDDVVGLIRP